jgi:hypothetical protein
MQYYQHIELAIDFSEHQAEIEDFDICNVSYFRRSSKASEPSPMADGDHVTGAIAST